MNNYIDGFRINWQDVPKDSYVRDIKALRKINDFKFASPITFFVGENGSGKSTLLEAIAEEYGFNKEGGTKNYRFSTYDEATPLKNSITLFKGLKKSGYNYFFRAETFFNIASKEEEYAKNDEGDYVWKTELYHNKSHGEGFLQLFKNLVESGGIYLMDEPEAALSTSRQLQLFSLIYDAAKKGSQFIIVTHSPILLGIPNADIYSFTDKGFNKCTYEDTDSYKITSYFINHRKAMIEELTRE